MGDHKNQNPLFPQHRTGSEELLNQSLRIVKDTELGRFILFSVSDDPIYFGKDQYHDFSPYYDVQIFSESISFTGDLFSPHGISISCNDIISLHPTKIDTSGEAGANQVIGGSGAMPGHNGGLINFYVQSGSNDVSQNLSFVTEGGKGGDALVSGAQAGTGGNGGTIVRIFQSRYSGLLGSVRKFLDSNDGDDKILNSPVDKNHAIYLDARQLLATALKSMVTEEKVVDRIHELRNLVSDIDMSIPSKVEDLVRRVRFIRNSLEDVAGKQRDDFSVAAHCKGGYGGSGNGVGITGVKGKNGLDSPHFLTTYDPDVSKTTFAFAHPEQCRMLLERGKIFYYMGSPELLVRAEIVFQRLVDRLSLLSTDVPSKAYTENDISKLQSIKTDAANCLMQLATGVSFNGHPNNWAPRASYSSYEQALDASLEDHEAFENAYIKYHEALDKQEKLTASVGLALQQTTQMIDNLTRDINDLVERLKETENRVVSLTDPVKITHSALLIEFEKLKDRIRNDFELSVPQLVNALTLLAFSPTKSMAGVAGGNLLYEGFTSVPDIEGHPVNKDYIIGKIKYGEATVKSIKNTLGKGLDGEFKVDDPFATRLMTAEDDMRHFLDAYTNSSFVDVIDEIKQTFDAFTAAIIARNEQAVLYNIQLKLYIEKITSRNDYEKTKKDLKGKEIEFTNPDLPSITAYVDDVYQSSRARVTNILDNLVRSLNFRMLTTYDIFHLAFVGTDPDTVPHTITSDVLRSGRSRIQDEFWKIAEIWGSEPARFPQVFDNPRGKRIYLSKSDRADLIRNFQVDVNIPVSKKDATTKTEFSGRCNVRIYRVRFGLTGLVAKKPAYVAIKLRHSGEEIIVDSKGLEHRFVHDPIKIAYSFNLNPDGTIDVLDNGNIAEADVDEPAKHYAAPGPFAMDGWTVDLRDSKLTALDFSNVTEAYFDFCGTDYVL